MFRRFGGVDHQTAIKDRAMRTLLRNRLGGRQLCQPTSFNPNEVHRRISIGSLILIIFLIVPLGGCASLDDLASGDSWFNEQPFATGITRYTAPTILMPLVGDEIATSDEEFKPFDFSLNMGPVQPQDQMDLHKANLISLLTNKSSRGSIAPWEDSLEFGQQIPSAAIWLASLETKYEPNLPLEVESEFVTMGVMAMAWNDDNDTDANAEADPIMASAIQNPLGISTGVFASTSVIKMRITHVMCSS